MPGRISERVRLQRLALMLVLLALVVPQLPARAAPLKPRPAGQRLCVLPPLALTPIFVTAPVAELAEDDEEDEEDEEDDEEEGDEDALGGFLTPDGTCIALSGGVLTGLQVARQTYSVGTGRGYDVTTTSLTGSMQVDTLTRTIDGTEVRSVFGFLFQPTTTSDPNTVLLTDARASIGGWSAGYGSSVFNFWTGDDFFFAGRIPARAAIAFQHTLQLTETISATLSVENALMDSGVQRPASFLRPPGLRWPDLVARILHEGEALSLHLAAALTERRSSDGLSTRVGKAGIAGATWTFDLFGRPQTLTGQIAGAIDAPLYLGTQLDMRSVFRLVDVGDGTRGYSAILSTARAWTDTISTRTYVSKLWLDFPQLGVTGGQATLWRGAWNVVWTPLPGFRMGLEAGIARGKVDLPNRIIPADISGRQTSAVLWFDRSF